MKRCLPLVHIELARPTLQALIDEAVQHATAVVAEGEAAIAFQLLSEDEAGF